MLEKITAKIYEYPPTETEANQTMVRQARLAFRFLIDPTMSVETYEAKHEASMARLKRSRQTEKYTLEELSALAQNPNNKLAKRLLIHEGGHAQQMKRVLKAMGISKKPEFLIYWCPILADMYQCGNGISLIEMNDISLKTKEEYVEFATQLAYEMLKTTDNSIGDLYLVGATVLAKVITCFHRSSSKHIEING